MAGYLDLAQRELRSAVVHPYGTAAELLASPGVDGQIATAEGSLYLRADGQWERLAVEGSLGSTGVVEVAIPAEEVQAGTFGVDHGFDGRPLVSITDDTGSVIGLDVTHDAPGRVTVAWSGDLPEGCVVTVVGQAAG